jgi:hypothetical protein
LEGVVTVFNGVSETIPGWGGAAGLSFLILLSDDDGYRQSPVINSPGFRSGLPKLVELQKALIGPSVLPQNCIKTEKPVPSTM